MNTLPLRIKIVRALNVLSTILLIFVIVMMIYSFLTLNREDVADAALLQEMTTFNKMVYFAVPLGIIFALFFLWQSYYLGKLNKNAYWAQLIVSIISAAVFFSSNIMIFQLVVIVIMLLRKTRQLFGLVK